MIEYLGGTATVHQGLLSVGCVVRPKTIQKWRERGNIPSQALAAITLYKARGNEDWTFNEYLQERA